MESQRSFLFIALMVVSFLLYQQWQLDNAPAQPQQEVSQYSNDAVPATNPSTDDFVPTSAQSASPTIKRTVSNAAIVNVATDVLNIKINTQGGDIVEATLLDYETEQGSGIPFTIMQNGNFKYIAQSGLTGAQGIDRTVKGRPIYQVSETNYHLNDEESLAIDLVFTTEDGLTVTKRFTFEKSNYKINVDYLIQNNTVSAASVELYAQLKQSSLVDE